MPIKKYALFALIAAASTPLFAWQTNAGSNFPEASTTSTDSGQTPVFKARTEVVAVPVVIRDKKGNTVKGLGKDVFQLEENGKKREIASFEEVQLAPVKPAGLVAADAGYSNLPLDASQRAHVTIVVLDLINTNELQRTDGKAQLIRFFSKAMPPGEPVSLLCLTNHGVQMVHPFTSDTGSLVQSLQTLKVEGHTLGQRLDIVLETLRQIREIANAYAGVPGRKSMIWLSGNILYPETQFSPYGDSRLQVATEFEDTWASLLSANIAVYPMGLLAAATDIALHTASVNQFEQTLRYFADRTGGILCKEDNGLDNCLNIAIEDARSYYLLTYALPPDDRKPGWRKLKVKVAAQSVDVRAREGFYYESPEGDAAKPKKPHADEINALASSLGASGVIMNVRVLPPVTPPNASGKITQRFLLTIPLNAVTVDPAANPALDIEVGAIALDAKMKDGGEFLHPVRGNPKPETMKRFAQEGISWEEKLDLAPGTYDMRFMVRDNPTGKIGTVVFPLEVK